MRSELILKFEFDASHSLAGYETPHPHLWRVEVVLGGSPVDGKIIDIVLFRQAIEGLIAPYKHTFLNDNPVASAAVRAAPTCETLSAHFFDSIKTLLKREFHSQNPTVQLRSVLVGIGDLSGAEMGAVRVFSEDF